MAHTHSNGSYTSASNSHGHTLASMTAKKCVATNPVHQHVETFPNADAHTHAVTLAFAGASLGSPNWWEHTHAISLVSCGNGGSSHNHTTTLLGASCTACPTPADHVHAQGTVAVANTDATHAHTLLGSPSTDYADPAGTPAAHTHTFSVTLNYNSTHGHTVSGNYAYTKCDGSRNHFHAAEAPISSNHQQGTSGSTPSGGEAGGTIYTIACSAAVTASETVAERCSFNVAKTASAQASSPAAPKTTFGVTKAAVVNSGASQTRQTAFNVAKSANATGSASQTRKVTFNVAKQARVSGHASPLEQSVFQIAKSASASSQAAPALQSLFNITKGAGSKASSPIKVQSIYSLTINALVKASVLEGIQQALGISKDAKVASIAIPQTLTEFNVNKVADVLAEAVASLGEAVVPVKQWGYVLPFKLVRKLGLQGVLVDAKHESLAFSARVKSKAHVSSSLGGIAVNPVSVRQIINISRLARKKAVGLHGASIVRVGQRSTVHGHLLRSQKKGIRVEGKQGFVLAAEVLGLLEATYTFMFVAVTDDRTCDVCTKFDAMTFDGAEIERMFPYATQVDYSLWMANLHKNCRCMLVLLEIGA